MPRVPMPKMYEEGYQWVVYKRTPTYEDVMYGLMSHQADLLVVELRTNPKRNALGWKAGSKCVDSMRCEWSDQEDVNAANAQKCALQILDGPKVSKSHGLNGLTGYVWGGVR